MAIDLDDNIIFYENDNGTIDKLNQTGTLAGRRFASIELCNVQHMGYGCTDPGG